jgi:hypothetical protein
MGVTGFISLFLLIVGNLLVKPFFPPKRMTFFSGLFEGFKDMRLSLLIVSSCDIYIEVGTLLCTSAGQLLELTLDTQICLQLFVPNFYITVYAKVAGMDQRCHTTASR